MEENCEYRDCGRPATVLLSEPDGDWVLCDRHGQRMVLADEFISGMRAGVLGGIFLGFLA